MAKQIAGFVFVTSLLATFAFGIANAETMKEKTPVADAKTGSEFTAARQTLPLVNFWELWSASKTKVTTGSSARTLKGRLKIARSKQKIIKTGKVSEVLAGRSDLWQIRLFPYTEIALEPSSETDVLTIDKGFVRVSATGQEGFEGLKTLDREFEEHMIVRAQNYTILPERRSHFYIKAVPQKGIWIKVVSGNILIETPDSRVLAMGSLDEWQNIADNELGLSSLRSIDLGDFSENLTGAGAEGDFNASDRAKRSWLNENLVRVLERFMNDGRAIEAYQIVESKVAATLLPKEEIKLKKAIILSALGFDQRAEALLIENYMNFPNHSETILTLAELQVKLSKLEKAEQLILNSWPAFNSEDESRAHFILGLIADTRSELRQAEVQMTFTQWSKSLCCARKEKMHEVLEKTSRLRPLRLIIPLSLQYDNALLPAQAASDNETNSLDEETEGGLSLATGFIASAKLHGFEEQDSSSGKFDLIAYGNYHFADSQRIKDFLYSQGSYHWQATPSVSSISVSLGLSALFVGLKFYKLSLPLGAQVGFVNVGLEYSLPVPEKTRHELALIEKVRLPLYPIFLKDSFSAHSFSLAVSAAQVKALGVSADTAESSGVGKDIQWNLKLEPGYVYRPNPRFSGTTGVGIKFKKRNKSRSLEASFKLGFDYALHPTLRLATETNLQSTSFLQKDDSSDFNKRDANLISSLIWSY